MTPDDGTKSGSFAKRNEQQVSESRHIVQLGARKRTVGTIIKSKRSNSSIFVNQCTLTLTHGPIGRRATPYSGNITDTTIILRALTRKKK